MKPLWRQVALFLVALACAIAALVAAGLDDERPGSDAVAATP
jgi:hypothetical protein